MPLQSAYIGVKHAENSFVSFFFLEGILNLRYILKANDDK